MRLATIRTDDGLASVRVDGEKARQVVPGDVATLLRDPIGAREPTPRGSDPVGRESRRRAPRRRAPEDHLPDDPTLFAKFPSALVRAYDDIVLPRPANHVDWEIELRFGIGPSPRSSRCCP